MTDSDGRGNRFLMNLAAGVGAFALVWIAIRLLPVPLRSFSVFRAIRPLVIAHRGGASLGPENTLLACRRSLAAGADAFELDLQLTRDGIIVVIHDEMVDSTTEATGRVADFTLAELKKLDAGYRFQDSAGGFPDRGRGVTIPTLEEIFRAFPHTPLVLEMKTISPEMERKLMALIERFDRRRTVVVSCEKDEPLRRFAALAGGTVPIGAGELEARNLILLAKSGADHLYPFRQDVLQIPVEASGLRLDTRRVIAAAHDRNVAVQYWTINDEATMRRLMELGADGLTTDRPDLAAAVVGSRPARGGR